MTTWGGVGGGALLHFFSRLIWKCSRQLYALALAEVQKELVVLTVSLSLSPSLTHTRTLVVLQFSCQSMKWIRRFTLIHHVNTWHADTDVNHMSAVYVIILEAMWRLTVALWYVAAISAICHSGFKNLPKQAQHWSTGLLTKGIGFLCQQAAGFWSLNLQLIVKWGGFFFCLSQND